MAVNIPDHWGTYPIGVEGVTCDIDGCDSVCTSWISLFNHVVDGRKHAITRAALKHTNFQKAAMVEKNKRRKKLRRKSAARPEDDDIEGRPEDDDIEGRPEDDDIADRPEDDDIAGRPEDGDIAGRPEDDDIAGRPDGICPCHPRSHKQPVATQGRT